MKPAPFTYHAPTSTDDALAVLHEHADEAKVLAGGQSLLPVLNLRLATPAHLVDINRLPGLDRVERTPTGWRIPALVRQRTVELEPELRASVPLLTTAVAQVAHPQIRNRGTVCGSLAHADSAAELPAVMVALDARMSIASVSGPRTVPADAFFRFHLTTAVQADELLLAVEFDDPAPHTYGAFEEFAHRDGDFCLAGTAVTVSYREDGTVRACRVVAAGVAPTPARLRAVEDRLVGSTLDVGTLAAAQRAAFDEVSPTGDVHADAAYRRQLASVLVRRALSGIRDRRRDDERSAS